MGKIVFVLGGVKSGKTRWTIKEAKKSGSRVIYLATGLPIDLEMEEKIKEHQKMRPKSWQTIEETKNLIQTVKKIKNRVIIIDCINFWLANVLSSTSHKVAQGFSPASYIDDLCKYLKKGKNCEINTTFLISNEVGMSLVSPNRAGRKFQELLGKVNQIIANYADKVYLMVAGMPVKVK